MRRLQAAMSFPLLLTLFSSILAFANAIAAPAGAGAQVACQRLLKECTSGIVKSSGQLYDEGATSAWNLVNANLRPDCIVFPRTTHDVSTAMKVIFQSKAKYAVQAGGHSAMKGWNNVQGGVLIHFLNMTSISYNKAAGSVTFEPGLTWGEALTALEPHGVAVAGGRVNTVGTGLLLGGGMSYLAPQVGYSADTMREVDVVLVDGTVVTATPTNAYSDLFKALKGGTNRFGIVTRYVVDAIPTGTKDDKRWFGGEIIYDNSTVDAVLTALSHFTLNNKDPKAVMLLYFFNGFANGTISPLTVLNVFYNGPSLPKSVFGEFLAIPAAQTSLSPLSYFDIAGLLPDPGAPISLVEYFGASVLAGSNDITPFRQIYAQYAGICDEFKNELGGTTLSFTPVPDSQITAGRLRGGNAIDAPHGGFDMIQFSLSLPQGPQDISPGLAQARQNFFQTAPRTPGLPLYVAESDKNQQIFVTYGGFDFLKKTYAKYDPTRFNVQFTDGPSGL